MSNRLTNWHLSEVRKPDAGERVLVVRKAFFAPDWYVDIARFDGEKFRCGGAVINVMYWHELPVVPTEEDVTNDNW